MILVVPLAVVKREENVASTSTLSQFFCLKASTPEGGSTECPWDHIAKAFTLCGQVELAIEEGKILEIREEEPAADARKEEVENKMTSSMHSCFGSQVSPKT